jgi:hypothetical protein
MSTRRQACEDWEQHGKKTSAAGISALSIIAAGQKKGHECSAIRGPTSTIKVTL